ncbi:MAG: hypothetical protein DRO39_05255 [Thermoprotei archaeon]|nr:MAG: hypothetical protein DRO39_05255 [Thermoprotei archaeon]
MMNKLRALQSSLKNALLSREARVLLYLAEVGRAESIAEISRATGISHTTCRRIVARLVEKGYVSRGSYIALSGNIARVIARYELVRVASYVASAILFCVGSLTSIMIWNPLPSIVTSAASILVLVAVLR